MNNKVHFTCTALTNVDKKGVIAPDENGYYTTVLGGLNVYNSAGEYYTLNGAKELFDTSYDSSFMRRMKEGCLYAELGHPKLLPNQSMDSFIQRVLTIEETRCVAHISEVWLDYDNVRDKDGRGVIAIMGKVKPAGAFGHVLKEAMENPKQNACFSIRAFTEDHRAGGVKQRVLRQIVTFDYVIEPGISFAKKFHSPALEALECVEVKREHFAPVMVPEMAMEACANSARELFTSVGWKYSGSEGPVWAKW